jgi:aryl-alcohol dehydrogenase-like predicted oxidoreductase
MEQRTLGSTKRLVSVVGLGTWQLGSDWGSVDETAAAAVLDASADAGVTFFDTADVYGDGRSEQAIRAFLRRRPDSGITVATKMGRRVAQQPEAYTLDNFRQWTDRSRTNLGVDVLDLVQLHCPPTAVYSTDAVFDALDTLVAEQRIAAYAVSVETCAEALIAIGRPGVASVQIILNAFRQKPLAEVLPAAVDAGVGIIARVPLASGLLSGRYTHDTTFGADDHRTYNRHGEAFDAGETFSGVDFDTGVDAAREFAALLPSGVTPAAGALR